MRPTRWLSGWRNRIRTSRVMREARCVLNRIDHPVSVRRRDLGAAPFWSMGGPGERNDR